MSNFASGMQMGLGAFQAGVANARADRQEARQRRLDAEAEIDREIERDRQNRIGESLQLEIAAKKDEAKRLVEATSAFEEFSAATSLIDDGDPEAPTKYSAITQQYLPKILKHDAVARKWEALDRVKKQGAAFTTKKVTESVALQAMQDAARIAPEILLDPPKKPDGGIDYAAVAERLRERQAELADQAINLRRAAVDARAEAERSGAYGGTTRRGEELPPGTKAELEGVADELKMVNKAMSEPNLRPDRKLELVNRKSALQRRLRSFDSRVAPVQNETPGKPPVGVPAPAGPAKRVGNFTIRPIN